MTNDPRRGSCRSRKPGLVDLRPEVGSGLPESARWRWSSSLTQAIPPFRLRQPVV